jgi:excisionase family DNA binding protein
MANQLASIGRTAETLGVSKDTIRRLVFKGEIRAVRVARRVMIPQSEIDRACTQGVGSPQPTATHGAARL